MKNLKYLQIFLIACMALIYMGCSKDFLDRPPLDNLTVSQYFKTDADLKAATAPFYGYLWFDYLDKFSWTSEGMFGDMQSDNASYMFFNATGTSGQAAPWRAFYNVIVQADVFIENVITNAGADVTDDAKNEALGEVRFFRALAYSYLIHIWGEGVPIIENPMRMLESPNIKRVVPEDVYAYIFDDLRFAKNNLPESSEAGRLTKWSAEAYLAKMYLHYAGLNQSGTRITAGLGLDSAKYYAKDVIINSGASLLSDYAKLFEGGNSVPYTNSETLIALGFNYNYSSWGEQNTRQAQLAAEGKITGAGDGWGSNTGVSSELLKLFMKEPQDLRRKSVFMMDGDHYPEILKAQGGYDYTDTTICCIKKYIIGTADDNNGRVSFMATDNNYYIMRLAELYLIYAEAILGNNSSTSDAEALTYFNLVRRRAGLPDKTSITFKDIFDEKRKELAWEDQTMFEYIRWFYFDPNAVIQELSNQDRPSGTHRGYNVVCISPGEYKITYNSTNNQPYTVDAEHIFLPYPETELIENPDLDDEPVHFPYN